MVRIVADTSSSIPPEVAEKLGIPYLPQIIMFGDETFRDDSEITTTEFLERLKTSPVMPKTSAPYPSLYQPIFSELLNQGHSILVLAPSSELSGTYRSAMVAAQDFPDADIHIMDTRTVAGGLGNLVILANQWTQQGVNADEIIARVKQMVDREHLYFVVDTLEYLHKGGRIGGAQALFGSILQMKPILTVKNGRIESLESQRTHKRAMARLRELIETECPKNNADCHLCVMHGGAEKEARELAEEFRNDLNLPEVPLFELPAAILTHSGPGAIAISFFA